jgi:hypothetical protein
VNQILSGCITGRNDPIGAPVTVAKKPPQKGGPKTSRHLIGKSSGGKRVVAYAHGDPSPEQNPPQNDRKNPRTPEKSNENVRVQSQNLEKAEERKGNA